MATDPFGKSFGGQTTLANKIPGMTSAAATPAGQPMPWKSYGEYFKDQPEAAKYGDYQSSATKGDYWANFHDQLQWPNGNPYRFSEEYNQYKTTLPQQYQDLMGMGISPEQVQSGQVKNIMRAGGQLEPIQMPGATPGGASPGAYGVGTGSSFSLSPDVLSKMWK